MEKSPSQNCEICVFLTNTNKQLIKQNTELTRELELAKEKIALLKRDLLAAGLGFKF